MTTVLKVFSANLSCFGKTSCYNYYHHKRDTCHPGSHLFYGIDLWFLAYWGIKAKGWILFLRVQFWPTPALPMSPSLMECVDFDRPHLWNSCCVPSKPVAFLLHDIFSWKPNFILYVGWKVSIVPFSYRPHESTLTTTCRASCWFANRFSIPRLGSNFQDFLCQGYQIFGEHTLVQLTFPGVVVVLAFLCHK